MSRSAVSSRRLIAKILVFSLLSLLVLNSVSTEAAYLHTRSSAKRNAYATMLYMGTLRDYEFYIAARVMLQTLVRFKVDADLVVIASQAVPVRWRRTLNDEGVKVKIVEDIPNPYWTQPKFNKRFLYTFNKLYVWSMTEYDRVVMLDADNLFLRNPDELFQCGQFCAAFINPCVFHTGLFVLQPSNETFNNMLQEIRERKPNQDGADQGLLTAYFTDLLDKPLFHPPTDGSRLDGLYRLPLGYQMDASYFYLKLKWKVPCGPNSVVTFPSVPTLKPWYWWSYPTLPLGISWHEKRRLSIGYGTEIPIILAEALFYIVTMMVAMFVRRQLILQDRTPAMKLCLGNRGNCPIDRIPFWHRMVSKTVVLLAISGSFAIPFFLIPTTVHPFMGWGVFLLGSMSLLIVTISGFQLRPLGVMTPWLVCTSLLLVMAWPFYTNGIVRILFVAMYACFMSPFLWWALKEIMASVDQSAEREPLMAWTNAARRRQLLGEW
ncbi:unnamed protein product [Sphagnum compactum]